MPKPIPARVAARDIVFLEAGLLGMYVLEVDEAGEEREGREEMHILREAREKISLIGFEP